MFGTVRKALRVLASNIGIAAKAAAAPTPTPVHTPRIPLLRRPRVMVRRFTIPTHPNGGKTARVKGKRDASLKSRSNRRKAAR